MCSIIVSPDDTRLVFWCEKFRDRLENENDDGVIIASAIKYTKINEWKIL